MKSGSDILKEVLEYTGETKNSLAKSIHLKRSQNLYDIESGKVKNISSELSEKIVTAYPIINRTYLMTGVGEMIVNGGAQSTTTKKVVHEKASALSKEITDKAFNNVTRKELAKLMAKVYGKPLQVILDELEESELLEASLLVKGV